MHLVGVARRHSFGFLAVESTQQDLQRLEGTAFRGGVVHGVDDGGGDAFGRGEAVVVVRQPREGEAFDETLHLSRHAAVVDGGGEHHAVGVGGLPQGFRQSVLVGADIAEFAVFQFASQTTVASFIVEVVKPDALHLNSLAHRLRTIGKGTNHSGGVHVFARSAVDNDNLLH